MNQFLRKALIPILSVLLSPLACSEKETSNDKFPDLPYFPASTNKHYQMKKTPFGPGIRLGDFSIELIDARTIIRDKNFNTIKVLYLKDADAVHYESATGEIFSLKDSTGYRYTPPAFKKEEMEIVYFKSSFDSIQVRNPDLDSFIIHNRSDSIDNIKLRKISACIERLHGIGDQFYLLRLKNNEYTMINWDGGYLDIDPCQIAVESGFNGKKLESFDKVYQGLSVYGSNHFAFGVTLNYIYYYRLVYGNDTLLFKSNQEDFEYDERPNTRRFILEGYSTLYEVTGKNR